MRLGIAVAIGFALGSRCAIAGTPDAASPAPSAAAAGPCAQGALASIADRPGLGRALAINGSPCAPPAGAVVLESGYRNQITTAAGTSVLSTFPAPVVRFGTGGGNEIVLAPSLDVSRRTGANLGGVFVPASGMQDAGIGVKHTLRDRPWSQDAFEAFVTVPTGSPSGPSGFSAGGPTYLLSYSVAFSVNDRVGLAMTHNLSSAPGTNAGGAAQRYLAYQPALTLSYALSGTTTFSLQEQITVPSGPGGPTGNRALVALQRTISPNVVIDVEFESNLLPPPGASQHALGLGLAVRL